MTTRVGWIGLAAGWGIVAGWWMPRGPLTISQALWSVALSAAVGALAGWFSRSRWSMLVAPAVFVVAVELLRLRVDGPSVDAPHASAFGLIALITGRGLHFLLSVLPMVLAAAVSTRQTTPIRYGRRAATGLLTALLLVLTVAVAVPARTPGVGEGGIAELDRIDGLGVLIRGADRRAPVLLFVPGAPGGSELGAARRHLAPLEHRFVVVTLDRRGGGSSYPELDPTATLTVDSAVGDIITVTESLRRRFSQQKIYLLGHSGGSMLSVLAVQRRPDLYAAYLGTGQAVDLTASDQIFYTDILAWARSTGRTALARTLTRLGPPPYRNVYDYEPIMLYENEAYTYVGAQDPFDGIGGSELTLLQKAHTINAVLDTWSVLYPRMQHIDLRRDVPELRIPVYFVQGEHEMRGLAALFTPWYETLRAPVKELTVVPGTGHRTMFEQPQRLAEVLDRALKQTRDEPGR